jgi:hypothetical protein
MAVSSCSLPRRLPAAADAWPSLLIAALDNVRAGSVQSTGRRWTTFAASAARGTLRPFSWQQPRVSLADLDTSGVVSAQCTVTGSAALRLRRHLPTRVTRRSSSSTEPAFRRKLVDSLPNARQASLKRHLDIATFPNAPRAAGGSVQALQALRDSRGGGGGASTWDASLATDMLYAAAASGHSGAAKWLRATIRAQWPARLWRRRSSSGATTTPKS